jgi:hypothetical protein
MGGRMKQSPRISKVIPLQNIGKLLNSSKPLTKADRDAICFAIETLWKRHLKLEKAHNANDAEMRETHILARTVDRKLDNVRAEMAGLRKRVTAMDSE